ncbi:MAG: hypothetical protein QOH71_3702 [Blastocatellia bacterium]|jgi:hypothetical protein|nr:hypothetical protein [Blastocatellia bacterium]
MGSVDVNKREANGEESPMFRLSAEGARQFLAQGNALGYERQLPRTLKEFANTETRASFANTFGVRLQVRY